MNIGYITDRLQWPYAAIGSLIALLAAYLFVWDNQYLWLSRAMDTDPDAVRQMRTIFTLLTAGVAWAEFVIGGKGRMASAG